MRVSQQFNLGRGQDQLEFVDVDLAGDAPLFVDPRALRLLESEWSEECVALVQDFFGCVIRHIGAHSDEDAKRLLRVLREPNETHLGLSKGIPHGHGLGDASAVDVWDALSESEAVRSGLLEDLEDTILMIPGVSNDIISDIATNIIRQPLIHFTQDTCHFYGIPMAQEVDSGPMWDPQQKQWFSEFVELPVTTTGRLLLVPKAIVRRRMDYDPSEYFNHYVLSALQNAELAANSELVELLRNGGRRVTKKALKEKYGTGKSVSVQLTRDNPEILDRYRAAKRRSISRPLSNEELGTTEGLQPPDWARLLQSIREIEPGRAGANMYHLAVEGLLQALFYPALVNPARESRIHDGRKRIDIRFSNVARDGFFWRIPSQHQVPAGYVVVECKNYSEDVANPEVDQVAGRFSPMRGRMGLLVCRSLEDRTNCIARCRDTAQDGRGWVLPLEDDDLAQLIEERLQNPGSVRYSRLEEIFGEII